MITVDMKTLRSIKGKSLTRQATERRHRKVGKTETKILEHTYKKNGKQQIY